MSIKSIKDRLSKIEKILPKKGDVIGQLVDTLTEAIKADPVARVAFANWDAEMSTDDIQRAADGEYVQEVAEWLDRMPALPPQVVPVYNRLLEALDS